MAAGRFGFPPPRAGSLQTHCRFAGRKTRRAAGIHPAICQHHQNRVGCFGRALRSGRAPQTHLLHLQKNGEEKNRFRRPLRHPRRACAGRQRARVLHHFRHCAQPVAADSRRIRRLHRPPQSQRLPQPAHRGGGAARQGRGSTNPHFRYAPLCRIRRGGALALQRRRQGRQRLRAKNRLAAPIARLARKHGRNRQCRLGQRFSNRAV